MIDLKAFKPIMFVLTPDLLIDTENNPLFKFLKSLVSSGDKENIYLSCQNVQFSVHGYDNDPRELYEITEFTLFCRTLSLQFPYYFYFFNNKLRTLIMAGALEGEAIDGGFVSIDQEMLDKFMERCAEHAVEFGVQAGHSEKEMQNLFLHPRQTIEKSMGNRVQSELFSVSSDEDGYGANPEVEKLKSEKDIFTHLKSTAGINVEKLDKEDGEWKEGVVKNISGYLAKKHNKDPKEIEECFRKNMNE